jgi:glutaredoxin
MGNPDVVIYVSDDHQDSTKVVQLVKEYDVSFQIKNVTQNIEDMKEMQNNGVYGTPVLFIEEGKDSILGFQQERIRHALRHLEWKNKE